MPKHPKRLFEKYDGQNHKYDPPYKMSEAEAESYNRYEFARRKYVELVNYLNSTNKDVNPETEEWLGFGGENGVQKPMDEQMSELLKEKCAELINASNRLFDITKKSIDGVNKNAGDEKAQHEYLKNRGRLIYEVRANRKRATNDVGHLESIDQKNMPSYMAMHRQSTEVAIDTSNMKVEKTGDVLSTRYKLRYMDESGKVKQGFFTVDVDEKKYDEKTNQTIIRNINQRNVAMSDIATMLGMGKMLAKSTEMTMINKGKVQHGCFMENANGIDFKDMSPDNPLLKGRHLGINYDKTVRSATDLMVLDYICLNRDRHERNHFYQVETNENGELEVVGFQGIDNDASFDAYIPENNKNYVYLPPLDKLYCLHKDTADAIMNIDLDMVKVNLSDHDMDPKAIFFCVKRIQRLQEKIINKEIDVREHFHEGDFETYDEQVDIDHPAKSGINPINNLRAMALPHYRAGCSKYNEALDNATNKKLKAIDPKGTKTKEERAKIANDIRNELVQKQEQAIEYKAKKQFLETGIKNLHNKVQMDQKMNITVQAQKVHKLFGKLWSPKDKDIPGYDKMYKSMKALDEKLTQYAKLSKTQPLNDMQQNNLAELYSNVEKNIADYVTEISMKPTKNDITRICISSAIQEICVVGKEQRERSLNELNELMSNASKSLGESVQNMKEKTDKHINEPNHPEVYLAKAELDAKSNLAAYVGSLTNPKGTYMNQVKQNIATIIVAEKFRRLEKANPGEYERQIQKLGTKNNTIQDISNKLLKDSRFKNLVGNVRPGQALTHKVQNYILDMVDKTDNTKAFVDAYKNGTLNQKAAANGPAV